MAQRAPDHGVVIMAYGPPRYLRQARNLALSLHLHSPHIPLTLVTDKPTSRVTSLVDTVIPMTGPPRTDCRPKLDLDRYTPYRRTLYLDADSLAVRDISFLFDRFDDHDFVVLGKNIDTGYWYTEVARLRQLAGTDTIPKFNGGVLYFRRRSDTRRIFADARELADRYHQLGLATFNHGIADEPVLAIALARRGVQALPTMPDASVSLLGLSSRPRINVLTGDARFSKSGRPMTPAVVHFAADFSSRVRLAGSYYRREALRLRLAVHGRRGHLAAACVAHGVHGLPCLVADVLTPDHCKRVALR